MTPPSPASMAFYTVLLPALIGGVGFWLAGKRSWLLPLFVAGAYLAGTLGLFGSGQWPPAELRDWLPWVALVLGVASALASATVTSENRRTPPGFVALTLFVAAMIFGRIIFAPLIQYGWTSWETPLWLLVFALVPAALRQIFCQLEARISSGTSSWIWPFFLVIWGTAVSIALVFAGSATLAHRQGVLVAAIGSWFLLSMWKPTWTKRLRSGLTFFVLLTFLHLAGGFFFAEMPLAVAGLLLLAPLEMFAGHKRSGLYKFSGIGLAMMILIVALIIGWQAY